MLFFDVVVWRVHVQSMLFGEGGGEITLVREIGLVMIVKSWLRYGWSLNGRRRRSLWSQKPYIALLILMIIVITK